MPPLANALRYWLSDIRNFSRLILQLPLREYQLQPADAILQSILHGQGRTFAVMMSRQSGKNELSAQIEAYLLNLYRRRGGALVKGSPTFKPQTINSILRLTDRLNNPWNAKQFRRREGYIVELDRARAFFFSAEPSANVVGATASLLLEADEAQDIGQPKWDKDFTPMGASTNVTTVFYGTAWTSTTFLAQTIAWLEQEQAHDGCRRVFRVTADQVAAEVPEYGAFVKAQIARLGRNHPLIRTQFFLEPIDGTGGLFPPQRRALMHGSHPRLLAPEPGHRYALLVDVAGEDETEGDELDRAMLQNPRRDATAITVVDVSLDRSHKPPARVFRTVHRILYLGTPHAALHAKISALARLWHATWIVVDATGVGAGLASFLLAAFGEDRVYPVIFSPKVKSDLGWDFLAIVETGRFQDYADDQAPETRQFWYEIEACKYEIRPGPQKAMRWGVWEAPAYDGLVARGHDDLLVSAALCAIVDQLDLPGDAVGTAVPTNDALREIDHANW
ncbi:MAG: hypothetical protein ACP5JG_13295 [Anaerolineae bacterium]